MVEASGAGHSSRLDSRLDSIRERLRQLARLDEQRAAFGASQHGWVLEPPARVEEIAAFEKLHGVELPGEMRRFLERVTAGGAGPHYGLLTLPMTPLETSLHGAHPWRMQEPFIGDTPNEEARIARDTSRRGGYLVLADQGCGYKSILVLNGPRRGRVLADMREAHEGFLPEAPSFLDWYERWLDRALIEWASAALPDIIRRPAAEREDHVRAGLEAATPLLERLANGEISDEQILTPEAERLRAIVFLRVAQGRFDEALAQLERVRVLDQRDAEAQRTLTLARIAGARADHAGQLALADEGLGDASAWYATKESLLLEKQDALLALGRREEAIATAYRRAKLTKDLFAYFDVAYMRIEDGDIESGARVLVEAARAGIGCADEGPLIERVLETAEGLLVAVTRNEGAAISDALRQSLRALAMAES